jgi:tetratricopeptide (TPR) repeat protein
VTEPRGPRFRTALFFVVAAFVVPAIVLLAIEGALRLAGYGYETSFLVERELDGHAVLTNNAKFGWRFFPRAVTRPGRPLCFAKEKPEGVFRAFVVGGSAAVGDPQPDFGMARYLQAMLEGRRPDLEFEIVNAGMTAINSHVVLPIVRDCLQADPDLIVVYLGNNEIVGPFGAGSVFGVPGAGLALARANVWAKSTRIGQLLDAMVAAVRGAGREDASPEKWAGMGAFLGSRVARDDPRLAVTYENFRGNLEAIAAAARARGVDVLFSTVGANLADCAPFASVDGASDAAEPLARGVAHQAAGRIDEALSAFEEAGRLEDAHAELHFRTARCLAARVRPGEAREHYRAALELDALRFRADEGINRVIREVATGSSTLHADAAAALAAESPDLTPGAALFDDHVHLTPAGNWVVAREILAEILPRLPAPPSGAPAGPLLDLDACRHRIGHTAAARSQALDLMTQRRARAPFAGNLDEAEWKARIAEERSGLADALTPEALRATVEAQIENVRRHPEDWDLRRAVLSLLSLTGNLEVALDEARLVAERFPFDGRSYHWLGGIYAGLGREEEAITAFRRAIPLLPGLESSREALGRVLVSKGKRLEEISPDEARAALEEAVRVAPEAAAAHQALGAAYLRAGRGEEAAHELARAVEIDPELGAAHKKLGDALLATSRAEEAIVAYGEALRVNPSYFLALVGLGDAHRAAGSIEAARRHYRRALTLKPGASEVREKLAELDRGGRAEN